LRNAAGTEEKVYPPSQVSSLLFFGYAGNDTCENRTDRRAVMDGGSGNDTLRGGPGNDKLYGKDGNDYLFGENGDDYLDGGNDLDRLYGGHGDDWLLAGTGNDILVGDAGDDVLIGGAGNDTYRFDTDTSLGTDWIYEAEGEGTDSLDFSETTEQRLTVRLGYDGAQSINANLTLALFDAASRPTMENATGGSLADRLIGNSLANTLNGGGGNDELFGGDGSDWLYGGDGADVLYGEGHCDYLYGGKDADRLYGGHGVDYVYGDEGNDTLYGYDPRELYHDTSADRLWGGSGDDVLYGGGGNDRLYGDDGNDSLFGENGDDVLDGGNGNDHLSGGPGTDTLYGGSGNDGLYGGSDAARDTLWGQAGADRFLTRSGDQRKDSLSNDVEIRLSDSGAAVWHEDHVAAVDQAFAILQEHAGSTAVLKDECMGDPLTFVMQGPDVDYLGMNSVDWSIWEGYYRRIYLRWWNPTSASANRLAQSTVVHEIAHNFDHSEYFLGGDEDNPLWDAFKELHNQSTVYQDYAEPYGMTHVQEDWATCWEGYLGFVHTDQGSEVLQRKLALVDQFFRDVV
jgi:Ca2+-binding RTX toxin-like protein